MQKAVSDAAPLTPGWSHAIRGLISAFVGGLFVAQAGGSDREIFLSIGFLLGAVGRLEIVIGGSRLGFSWRETERPELPR